MTTHITSIRTLTDDTLIARTKTLVHTERRTTALLVAHLAEMDARRLYLAEGCSSLFTYCMQVLHLSEFAAYTRIAAARAGRKFPLVFECLARGDVHLSAVDRLAPHLTEENHRDLLDRARHLSKRDVEKLVAEIAPKPPMRTMVRPVAAPTPSAGNLLLTNGEQNTSVVPAPEVNDINDSEQRTAPGIAAVGDTSAALNSCRRAPKPARVAPLSPEHYRVQFTADPETVALLRRAQDLLRHQVPNGDPATVFKMALRDLVQRLERTKIANVKQPRKAKEKGDTAALPRRDMPRRIPAAVRREVWKRDEARCAFRTRDGRRCIETGHLEFHHVHPFARGGRATRENIELRCRAHNGYEAVRDFGRRPGFLVREEPVNWSRGQFERGELTRRRQGAYRFAGQQGTCTSVTTHDDWRRMSRVDVLLRLESTQSSGQHGRSEGGRRLES